MAVDKHSQDAVAKLYAEWVSAGVKLSVAGFAATTKIMEAATQSMVSSRAKAHVGETAMAATAGAKQDAKPAAVPTLKIVPAAKPAKSEPSGPVAAVVPSQGGTVTKVVGSGVLRREGDGVAAQLTLDGTANAAIALIIAPGSVLNVAASSGCTARNQTRPPARP